MPPSAVCRLVPGLWDGEDEAVAVVFARQGLNARAGTDHVVPGVTRLIWVAGPLFKGQVKRGVVLRAVPGELVDLAIAESERPAGSGEIDFDDFVRARAGLECV